MIFGAAFLPLTAFAAGGTHSTATFLRSVATAWAFFGNVNVAADDGEIGLALGQRLRARAGAFGLHRAQADLAARLAESLRQRLDHPDVIAVGRTDRDPQGHRAHRKVVDAGDRADDGEKARQRDEHGPAASPSGAKAVRVARQPRVLRSSISQTIV